MHISTMKPIKCLRVQCIHQNNKRNACRNDVVPSSFDYRKIVFISRSRIKSQMKFKTARFDYHYHYYYCYYVLRGHCFLHHSSCSWHGQSLSVRNKTTVFHPPHETQSKLKRNILISTTIFSFALNVISEISVVHDVAFGQCEWSRTLKIVNFRLVHRSTNIPVCDWSERRNLMPNQERL